MHVYHRVSMNRVCPCCPGTQTEMVGNQTKEIYTAESESDWTLWHRLLTLHIPVTGITIKYVPINI